MINENHITTNIDSIEEMLDMPTEGEVHLNLPLKNADCKVQMNLTNGKIPCGIFCVTGKDLEFINIDSMFDNDKMVI